MVPPSKARVHGSGLTARPSPEGYGSLGILLHFCLRAVSRTHEGRTTNTKARGPGQTGQVATFSVDETVWSTALTHPHKNKNTVAQTPPAWQMWAGFFLSRLACKLLLDRSHQVLVFRRGQAAVAVDHRAVPADQVLVEVPLRRGAAGLDELGEQRIGIATAHMALAEHRELHAEGVRAERGDLLVGLVF